MSDSISGGRSARTLADQFPALDALVAIRATFGHLPAAILGIHPVWPGQVEVSVHRDLGAFEAWREALGIPADAVRYQGLTSQMSVKAEGRFAGATVELTGFAPALPELVGPQYRAALLDEQRHQVHDEAVPDPAAYIATATATAAVVTA